MDNFEKLITNGAVVRVFDDFLIEDGKRVAKIGPIDFKGKAPYGIANTQDRTVAVEWNGEMVTVSFDDYKVRATGDVITSLDDAYEVGGQSTKDLTQRG